MGKPGIAFLLSHGWHSIMDMHVRSHTVYANLRQTNGSIAQSSLYGAMDPTEKGAASYFMGMLAAKVLGYRLLDVAWLFHLSMLNALGGSANLIGKSQPDLIGLKSNGDWVVAEAKGRSGGYSHDAMISAKLQTRQLRQINGHYPCLRVAIQAFFNSHMEWALEDPEDFDEQAPDLEFDLRQAFARYYSGAMAVTRESMVENVGNRQFRVRILPEIGVTIAIELELEKRIERLPQDKEFRIEPVTAYALGVESGFVTFPDGISIALDQRWSEHVMMVDPQLRQLVA